MRALTESNSRAIQAMAEDTARLKLCFEADHERDLRGREELRQAMQSNSEQASRKLDRLEAIVESNSRAIQAMADDTARLKLNFDADHEQASRKLDRLEAIVESNSRAIQAMADNTAEMKLNFEAGNERENRGREELRQAMLGIAHLVISLDEDRPTIFRKLNSIENKVDQILEQQNED